MYPFEFVCVFSVKVGFWRAVVVVVVLWFQKISLLKKWLQSFDKKYRKNINIVKYYNVK